MNNSDIVPAIQQQLLVVEAELDKAYLELGKAYTVQGSDSLTFSQKRDRVRTLRQRHSDLITALGIINGLPKTAA